MEEKKDDVGREEDHLYITSLGVFFLSSRSLFFFSFVFFPLLSWISGFIPLSFLGINSGLALIEGLIERKKVGPERRDSICRRG